MNKICTSLEQSKKLIELGIDPKTSDMIYYWFGDFELNDEWYELHLGTNKVDDKDIPAWSLSALLGLMPKFTLEREVSNEKYLLYYNYNQTYYDDPVDAAFGTICWLKKYGKI